MARPYAELSPLDRIVDKAAEMAGLEAFNLDVTGQSAVLQLAWRVAKAGSRDVETFFDGMSGYPYTGGSRAVYDDARRVGDLMNRTDRLGDRRSAIIHIAELAGLLRQQREFFPKRELLAAAAMGLSGFAWTVVGHAIVSDDAKWLGARQRAGKIRGNRRRTSRRRW